MLHEFVTLNHDEIIRRCRAKVAMRSVRLSTESEIEHGVPLFLDQLVNALHLGRSSGLEIGKSAVLHGHDLLRQGFTVSQVVHDYGDICQSITELAVETSTPISPDDFGLMSACLDHAMAGAVTEYQRAGQLQASIAEDNTLARTSSNTTSGCGVSAPVRVRCTLTQIDATRRSWLSGREHSAQS